MPPRDKDNESNGVIKDFKDLPEQNQKPNQMMSQEANIMIREVNDRGP